MKWNVRLGDAAQKQLLSIKDSRIRTQILKRIDTLENEPEHRGKPLDEDLYGYRSIRAVGQRYRIIYKVYENEILVLVVMLGIRKEGDKKDVYALAKKLEKFGLLDLIVSRPPEAKIESDTTEE